MEFLNDIIVKVDDKRRVSLPAALMKKVPESTERKLVLVCGSNNCIVLRTKDEYQTWKHEVLDRLSQADRDARRLARALQKGITELTIDSQNRINIPDRLLAHANIEKELQILPNNGIIELWNPATYEAYIDINEDEMDLLMEKYLSADSPKLGSRPPSV